MTKYARLLIGVAIVLMVAPITGFAQGTTASLNGTVVDEGGLVLPGVTVTAVHLDTNRPYVTVTGGQGEYSVLAMTPGVYSVEAELVGFGVTRIEEPGASDWAGCYRWNNAHHRGDRRDPDGDGRITTRGYPVC